MRKYNALRFGSYANLEMVEETDGEYIWHEDVEAMTDEVMQDFKAITDIYEYNNSTPYQERALAMWSIAKKAIAKLEGGTE
jgi:hypothetical protein